MQKSNKLKIEDIPRVKKHAISNELTTLTNILNSIGGETFEKNKDIFNTFSTIYFSQHCLC